MISFFTNVIYKINKKIKQVVLLLKNKKIKLNILLDVKTFFMILIISTTFAIMLSNPEIIIYFSNNFRQADNIKTIGKNSISIFSIYNSNNYSLSEIIKEPEKEIKREKIEKTEYQILDEMAKIENEVAVFNEVPEVVITENSSNLQRAFIGNVAVLNYSYNRSMDYSALIRDSSIILTKKSDKILLYNTHTSESYANSEKYVFNYTGTRRTTDANFNMLRIAKEFSENLLSKGFTAIQDTTPHDYGTYTSAYSKSRITVENQISSGGFGLIVDVHRDAIADLDFRPAISIRNISVAKIMFVIGAGSKDNENPYFLDNLKLALKLQYIGEKVYPGIFRPMIIRNSIYNQDLNKYSILIEVGASR